MTWKRVALVQMLVVVLALLGLVWLYRELTR